MTDRPNSQSDLSEQQDQRRIEEIFTELENAFREADAARFDARFTQDVVFTAVNGARFVGWDALHAYHRERLAVPTDGIRTWYEIERVTFLAPGVAMAFFRQPIETAGTRRANVGTWILVKQDGDWWICAGQNTGVAGQ